MVITVTKRCSIVATSAREAQRVSAAKFSGGTFSRQCLGSTGHWENTVRALVPAKHRSQSTADLTPSAEGADLAVLARGRNEVDGGQRVHQPPGLPDPSRGPGAWEGHARYGDIHIMVSGRERTGVSHVSQLARTVEKEAEDFLGFEGPVRAWLPMEEDDVLIVAHMVKVRLGQSMPVSRAVVKFKL